MQQWENTEELHRRRQQEEEEELLEIGEMVKVIRMYSIKAISS